MEAAFGPRSFARFRLSDRGVASLSAVRSFIAMIARACSLSSAAFNRTVRPMSPFGHHAVDDERLRACTRLLQYTLARSTTICCRCSNVTDTRFLRSSITTIAESGPLRQDAINWIFMARGVAPLCLNECTDAWMTTFVVRNICPSVACAETGAIRWAPCAPSSELAINGVTPRLAVVHLTFS